MNSSDQQFWGSCTSSTAHHRSCSSSFIINNKHSSGSSYHHRSHSFVTINNEKIIKRQRSTPQVNDSPTRSNSSTASPGKPIPLANIHRLTRANTISSDQALFSNKPMSSPMMSPLASSFEQSSIGMNSSEISVTTQDFQPPTTSFRNSTHNLSNGSNRRRKSLSSNFSSCSINSISSSAAESDYAGSVDSALTEPYTSSSPLLDSSDYFDNGAKRQNLIAMPISKVNHHFKESIHQDWVAISKHLWLTLHLCHHQQLLVLLLRLLLNCRQLFNNNHIYNFNFQDQDPTQIIGYAIKINPSVYISYNQ